jgi:DNA-binding CsgD family transcriptional regulator
MHVRASPQTEASPSSVPPEVLQCLLSAIDKLDLGILLVSREGRIAFANHAAETLLRLRKGSRIGSQATGHSPPIAATLDRQLRAVIRRGRNRPEHDIEHHVSLTISGGRSLFLLSVPCSGAGASDRAIDILFVSQASRDSPQDLSAIAPHYGLTRAETRLLQALVKGDTIGAYAKRAGITLHTAKGHLKHLFRKTTTARQSDLMRLILGNPILHLVSNQTAAASASERIPLVRGARALAGVATELRRPLGRSRE